MFFCRIQKSAQVQSTCNNKPTPGRLKAYVIQAM